MKTHVSRILGWVAILAGLMVSSSCMTTYDAYGRPVQSVDPGAAVAGAAAAGIAGYALGNSNDHHHHYRGSYYRPYYRGGYYYR